MYLGRSCFFYRILIVDLEWQKVAVLLIQMYTHFKQGNNSIKNVMLSNGVLKMYAHFKRCYLCFTFRSWIELLVLVILTQSFPFLKFAYISWHPLCNYMEMTSQIISYNSSTIVITFCPDFFTQIERWWTGIRNILHKRADEFDLGSRSLFLTAVVAEAFILCNSSQRN